MSMKSILSAREFTAKKSFFFTAALSLCLIGKAYGKDAYISIGNMILDGPYDTFKGYLVEVNGDGSCMYGVYNPSSCTAKYADPSFCDLSIHYKASGYCQFHSSVQNFKVINKDTGNITGMFTWKKKVGKDPVIIMTKNPDHFMMDVTSSVDQEMYLNLRLANRRPE